MAITLLFPPATDPRAPHLALPALAAHLRSEGIDVDQRDLDLEALIRGVAADHLEAAARRLRDQPSPGDAVAAYHRTQLLADADNLSVGAPLALASLRDPEKFYDPHRHHWARACLGRALELGCATGPVRYAFNPAAYEIEGLDAGRLDDLDAATAEPALNLFADLYAEVIDELDRDRPELVGVSILNRQQIIPGLTLCRVLRARGHTVVVGGTVYAKFVDRLRQRPRFFELFCDYLVPYEGETALLELIGQLRGNREFTRVPNLLWLEGGEVRAGPTHVEDMRQLQTPDFDGLALGDYLTPEPVLPILTGKGCYFNRCKFCDIPFINEISTKPYRVRGTDQIAHDCATLNERHGVRHFEITDETLSPKLLLKLGESLKAGSDIDPRFVGYARFEHGFTPEACEAIADMGMTKLYFGLESGSQRMLDHMDKGVTVGGAREVLRNCAGAGIAFHIFSIIGFPEETEADARETLHFLLDEVDTIGPPQNSFDVHPFGLDLRTDYFDHASDYGVEVDIARLDAADFPIGVTGWRNTRGLSDEDVERLLDEFRRELCGRYLPWRSYPSELWPGFEEYAVLYSRHYETHRWAYRFAVPADDEGLLIQLRWAEGVRLEPVEGGFIVRAVGASPILVTETVVALLAQVREPQPISRLLHALVGADGGHEEPATATLEAMSEVIDGLLEARVLWLDPAPGRPARSEC